MALTLLAGCKPVEPAPDDLDGLFKWLWNHFEDASDADYAQAAMDLADVSGVLDQALGEAVDGTLTDLTRTEQDAVGMREDADPSVNQGLFLLNRFACTTPKLESIVVELDQMGNYGDAYDAYERRYTSDDAAYWARDVSTVSFVSDIEATLLGAAYTESIHGTVRYVDPGDAGVPLVAARYHLPEPAVFGNDDFFFEQDYQVELYWESAPGELVHLYGLWRLMGFLQTDLSGGNLQRQVLNGLADWDSQTEALCAE